MQDSPHHSDWETRAAEADRLDPSQIGAVARLSGGIAHDFNNLLAVIVGHVELLREQLDGLAAMNDADALRAALAGGRLHASLDHMARAALRGAEVTHHLLAFARLQVLRPQPTDVNRLIADMTAVLHDVLGPAVALRMQLDPAVPQIAVDRAQLQNAILTIAANAHDAMPNGGAFMVATSCVQLATSAGGADSEIAPGGYVRLELRDTGQGMTPEVLAHAFEPYFTTKETGTGAGLGLPTVQGFMAQSGGGAQLSSAPGQGTTVRLHLPIGDTAAAVEAAEQAAPGDAAAAAEPPTVLLVEDDPGVRELVATMLEDLGCRVQRAANGPQALALLRAVPRADLLLTDVVLPDGPSGPEIAHQAVREQPGLKVLYMSGYPAPAARRDQTLRPGENLLAKPFRKADLAQLLRRSLGFLRQG